MAIDADIQALIAKFEKIEHMTMNLYPEVVGGSLTDSDSVMAEVVETASARPSRLKALISRHDDARIQFFAIAPNAKVHPDYIPFQAGLKPSEYEEAADRLKISCATALAFLRTLASRISPAEKDKMDSLRNQIAPLETHDPNLFKHLMLAVDEYESAHFLASALLAGKSVVYVLNHLQGENEEEKVNYLVKRGLVREQLKDKMLRAARRARNYFSHDMSAFAEPSDALNSISDAVDFSLKLKSAVGSQSK
jgi:hypothetical protein